MSAQRLLIAGPAWVGDMVMTQSLCLALRRQQPEATIDILAPAWSLPLIARMPEVRAGIELPTGHGELGWAKRRAIGRRLRGRYDRAIVLPRSAKAALVPFFARVPVRTGYRGELRYGLINDMRRLDKRRLPQTVQRFTALGYPPGAPQPPDIRHPWLRVDAGNRQRLLGTLDIDPSGRHVGLMPGAEYGPAKRWPAAHFGVLARRLAERGVGSLIFGSAGERDLGAAIAAHAPDSARNLCGRTELADVVDLAACCRAVVSNDSGLMHVAAAVGVPLVALYGSSSPAYTPPLSGQARILYRHAACSPCFQRTCPLGHAYCLAHIAVADVGAALAEAGMLAA